MSFSADGKTLVAQGGAPEWNLTMWAWEKGKQSFSTKPAPSQQPCPVTQARAARRRPASPCWATGQQLTEWRGASGVQVAFHQQDPSLLSVIGTGLFRTFRCTDTALKPQLNSLAKREPQAGLPDHPFTPCFTLCLFRLLPSRLSDGRLRHHLQPAYTCHCWLPDDRERLLVGTDLGEILLLEGGEVKTSLTQPGAEDAAAIVSIVAHSKARRRSPTRATTGFEFPWPCMMAPRLSPLLPC